MNKSELAGRLADRMALSRCAAAGAVDAVCETIREALAQGEEVRHILALRSDAKPHPVVLD